ncbi:MAG: O-antigen ligase family protein [Beijerinckiaceae bacterium]
MSAALPHQPLSGAPRWTLSLDSIRGAAVWLLFASGFLVFIEPAPFEIAFALVAAIFFFTGLRLGILFLPLVLLLVLYNVGGGLSLMEVANETRAVWFVVISVYMAIMAIVIAAIFSEDTLRRLELMKSGYALAAVFACLAGIMGYFNVAGTFDIFTRYGRAMGTFKDPNVFSTFIILPIVYIVQGFFVGSHRRPVIAAGTLLILMAGLFLSFSRGAWAVAVGAIAMCLALSFLTAESGRIRRRIVLIALAGLALLVILMAIALQFEAIRATFEVRASLNQDYDHGETGRFGNQRRSIPFLLELPNGFGPTMFRDYFPEDPHNTYLNAFSSYGWLGGLSYLALVFTTIMVGFKLVFRRTPWQREAIAIWSSFFLLILQGFQIDTDHWRHFYVQLGLTWGLMQASLRYRADAPAGPMPIAAPPAWTHQSRA